MTCKWNLYDQSTQSTYPDRSSGYWREKPDAEISSIYSKFTVSFGDALGRVNDWRPDEQMGGILVRGRTVWLLRVHNGGKDTRNRPQRWVIAACCGTLLDGCGIDIGEWLNGGQWPFFGVIAADVPLPPDPDSPYRIPTVECGKDDWRTVSRAFEDVPAMQAALNAWLGAPHREMNGDVFFSTVGGRFFKINGDFRYGRAPLPEPKPVVRTEPKPVCDSSVSTSEPIRPVFAIYDVTLSESLGADSDAWRNDPDRLLRSMVSNAVSFPKKSGGMLVQADCMKDLRATMNAWLAATHKKGEGRVFLSMAEGRFSVTGVAVPHDPAPVSHAVPAVAAVVQPCADAGRPCSKKSTGTADGTYTGEDSPEKSGDRRERRSRWMARFGLWLGLILSFMLNVMLGAVVCKMSFRGNVRSASDAVPPASTSPTLPAASESDALPGKPSDAGSNGDPAGGNATNDPLPMTATTPPPSSAPTRHEGTNSPGGNVEGPGSATTNGVDHTSLEF